MTRSVELDEKLVTRLEALAERRGRCVSDLIEDIVRAALIGSEEGIGDGGGVERPRAATAAPDYSEGFSFPTFDGGGFPPGFPFDGSAAKMIEFLEGPNAPP